MRIRKELSALEKDNARDGVRERKFTAISFLNNVARGDIVIIDSDRRSTVPYVVIDEAQDYADPRPRVMSLNRQVKRIGYQDVGDTGRVVGQVRLPPTFDSRSAKSRAWLADQMKNVSKSAAPEKRSKNSESRNDIDVDRLRKALRSHPCHGCNDRDDHARWHERLYSADREIRKLENRVEQRTSSIAREFDRVCEVLTHFGYLKKIEDGHEVTPDGHMLGRIYCERDLLAAECIKQGLWSSLEPDELAGIASMLVFDSRRDDEEETISLPEGAFADVVEATVRVWGTIKDVEAQFRTDYTPEIDVNFVWPMLRWARGQVITKVLRNSEQAPGDFVRWTKQVIDIVNQIGLATDDDNLSRTARKTTSSLERGIVAW